MRKALSSAQAYVPEIDFRRWASGVRRREEIYFGGGLLALMLLLLAQARCGGLLLVVTGRQWRCRASWTGASSDISVRVFVYKTRSFEMIIRFDAIVLPMCVHAYCTGLHSLML